MLIVRATKKLLHLTGPPTAREDDRGTTPLGRWYATVLFWRPRIALVVNESTLLPVLMPLAPAANLTSTSPNSLSGSQERPAVRCTGGTSAQIVNWPPPCTRW